MKNVSRCGSSGVVVSKKTGEEFTCKLIAKGSQGPKFDMFLFRNNVVWRDSIRRRYKVKDEVK